MTTNQSQPPSTPNYDPIKKPAEIAESRLIEAILTGSFPINSALPGERELSEMLGVTRPTLRETLQRLARDGWVEIHQGKPTRVCDYWQEGKLGVLNALSQHPRQLPSTFIPDLLTVRLATAPMYTSLAVANAPEEVVIQLAKRTTLVDSPNDYAVFDWELQHNLTLLGENVVFTLLLNGFKDLYLNLAPHYFAIPQARQHSFTYYEALAQAAAQKDLTLARTLTEDIMRDSLAFWQQTKFL